MVKVCCGILVCSIVFHFTLSLSISLSRCPSTFKGREPGLSWARARVAVLSLPPEEFGLPEEEREAGPGRQSAQTAKLEMEVERLQENLTDFKKKKNHKSKYLYQDVTCNRSI